jgi:hypothetical protein
MAFSEQCESQRQAWDGRQQQEGEVAEPGRAGGDGDRSQDRRGERAGNQD